MPKHCFSIAGITVGIDCADPSILPSLDALTCLYRQLDSNTEPDLLFTIENNDSTFALRLNRADTLWESKDRNDMAPAFELHLYRTIIEHTTPAYLSVHASGIAIDGRTCMFAGESGAGKSSLCTEALMHGASYFSDEFSLLDDQGRLMPFPRPLQWDSIDHPAFDRQALLDSGLFTLESFSFSDPDGGTLTSHLWLPRNLQQQPQTLDYLFLPTFTPELEKTEINPVCRGEAIVALSSHLHVQSDIVENIRQLNRRIGTHTRFYSLKFSNVHHAWDAVARTITE